MGQRMSGGAWAVMISGTGSNLQAILDQTNLTPPKIVISSNPKAPGLGKARRMGIPTCVLSKPIDWQALDAKLKSYRIDKIFLLGFMKVIPVEFLNHWTQKIINLHPSFLPTFPGLHAFEKAYAAESQLGATVHEVTAIVDQGKILLQKKFSKLDNEVQTRLRLSFVEQSLVVKAYSKGFLT